MSQWYVKELSQLTGVSVQTLHHYDRINLLKPSLRMANGYRVYNQKDLLRLQQIIALKFFGFELSHIKTLIESEKDTTAHFKAQIESLEAKAKTLMDASHMLKQITQGANHADAITWEDMIKMIEVYRMSEKLEHTWVKEIFTTDELKQYVSFETEWKNNSTPEEKAAFENDWMDFVSELNANLEKDPMSKVGIALGQRCMDLVNAVYGKKYAHLRTKKFEHGFAQGKGLEEVGLTSESVAWLDKAIDAYWKHQVYQVLDQVGKDVTDEAIYHQWQAVLDEICGDDVQAKMDIYETTLSDKKISRDAKAWLKTLKDIVGNNSHLQ